MNIGILCCNADGFSDLKRRSPTIYQWIEFVESIRSSKVLHIGLLSQAKYENGLSSYESNIWWNGKINNREDVLRLRFLESFRYCVEASKSCNGKKRMYFSKLVLLKKVCFIARIGGLTCLNTVIILVSRENIDEIIDTSMEKHRFFCVRERV